MQRYDFKAAREHIQRLTGIYRALKRQGTDLATLYWIASEIDCLEMEIAEAHKNESAGLPTDTLEKQNNVLMFPILTH